MGHRLLYIKKIFSAIQSLAGTIHCASQVIGSFAGLIFAVISVDTFKKYNGATWSNYGDVFDGTASVGFTRVSEDGQKIWYACQVPMLSVDAGKTFQTVGLASSNYSTAAMSADGQYLASCYSNGYVVASSDGGQNFANKTLAGYRNWRGVAISANGQYWVCVAYNSQIVVSSDYGATFQTKGVSLTYYDACVSGDGHYQTAIVYGGGAYRSTDYGATWNAVSGLVNVNWNTCDCSESGEYQYIASIHGVSPTKIYRSTDYGATWSVCSTSFANIYSWIRCSSNGKHVVAGLGSVIYYSKDYGVTWSNIDPGGTIQAIGINRNLY